MHIGFDAKNMFFIFTLAMSALCPISAFADDPVPDSIKNHVLKNSEACRLDYGRLYFKSRKNPAQLLKTQEELTRLESIAMSDLFKESLEVRGGANKGKIAKITAKEIQNFKIQFDHLVEAQAKLDPDFKKELSGFRDWLLNQSGSKGAYPELDKIEIEAYRKANSTLNDFVSDSYVAYQRFNKGKESYLDIAKSLSARSLRRNLKSLLHFGYVRSRAFIGVFIGTSAALTLNTTLTEPIKKWIGIDEKSLKDNVNKLKLQGELLTIFFSNFEGGKKKYNETLRKIEELSVFAKREDLSKLDRESARTLLEKQDSQLQEMLSKYSRSLDIADANRHTRQKEVLKNLLPGMQVSEFNYNAQREALKELQSEIDNRGSPATQIELNDMKAMEESMHESELDLATALAMWKLYKFTLNADELEAIKDLDRQYNLMFINYMRFKDLSAYKNTLLEAVDELQIKLKGYSNQ